MAVDTTPINASANGNGAQNGNGAASHTIPPWSLEGKVAVVTGSGRGIGKEMALELARRGADIVVNYANTLEGAQKVVNEIKAMGRQSIAIKANVANVSETVSLFEQAKAHFGKINIVCSNSGVVSFGHLKDVTEEEYDRVMSINTRGQFFVAREAYKNMEIGGRIILMGSITAQAKGVPKHTLYSGSKGAIETFVRCMAIDAGDKKITVNCIAPGGIKTDMYHAVCKEYIPNGEGMNNDEVDEYAKTWSPHMRVGQPSDVARVVAFLASQDGEWVNGKVIGIDGAACM
ncbi:tetrahydroxynaphthalene reductase [Pseudovirgaria hyperparasitica]|uniref:Tetrahydroxynaphthalene reductase n=1 Tax=Pseudovirgaria hyperparasitica TaxID=470096 RepID=A0A6A6W889_9PEZI|nr:tetrahydroxynaphthalene reductase [Pseudovirgaria hyperparasitica]KAF2758170.1 tetrahydroxynaphthalene reductase [Pseudovirgaria hyperparasitica]